MIYVADNFVIAINLLPLPPSGWGQRDKFVAYQKNVLSLPPINPIRFDG